MHAEEKKKPASGGSLDDKRSWHRTHSKRRRRLPASSSSSSSSSTSFSYFATAGLCPSSSSSVVMPFFLLLVLLLLACLVGVRSAQASAVATDDSPLFSATGLVLTHKLSRLNASAPTRFLLSTKSPHQQHQQQRLQYNDSKQRHRPVGTTWSSFDNYSLAAAAMSSNTSSSELAVIMAGPEWKHPLLGFVLSLFSLTTIFGNTLVIVAVVRERYLKSATNYYIVSLAVADLIVGLLVMPFNAINEMTNNFWFFGDVMCELWHAFDVFASTASINSLLIIALDRHSAISDPISYHARWMTRHWLLFIAGIWGGSACISFPAIAYWRSVNTVSPLNQCVFTDDIYYLVFSSLVSFYCPLAIMIVVYVRIYRAAMRQMTALKTGHHKLNVKGSDGTELTLRVHRGGYHRAETATQQQAAPPPQASPPTPFGPDDLARYQNAYNNRSFRRSTRQAKQRADALTTRNQLQQDPAPVRLTTSRSEYHCEQQATERETVPSAVLKRNSSRVKAVATDEVKVDYNESPPSQTLAEKTLSERSEPDRIKSAELSLHLASSSCSCLDLPSGEDVVFHNPASANVNVNAGVNSLAPAETPRPSRRHSCNSVLGRPSAVSADAGAGSRVESDSEQPAQQPPQPQSKPRRVLSVAAPDKRHESLTRFNLDETSMSSLSSFAVAPVGSSNSSLAPSAAAVKSRTINYLYYSSLLSKRRLNQSLAPASAAASAQLNKRHSFLLNRINEICQLPDVAKPPVESNPPPPPAPEQPAVAEEADKSARKSVKSTASARAAAAANRLRSSLRSSRRSGRPTGAAGELESPANLHALALSGGDDDEILFQQNLVYLKRHQSNAAQHKRPPPTPAPAAAPEPTKLCVPEPEQVKPELEVQQEETEVELKVATKTSKRSVSFRRFTNNLIHINKMLKPAHKSTDATTDKCPASPATAEKKQETYVNIYDLTKREIYEILKSGDRRFVEYNRDYFRAHYAEHQEHMQLRLKQSMNASMRAHRRTVREAAKALEAAAAAAAAASTSDAGTGGLGSLRSVLTRVGLARKPAEPEPSSSLGSANKPAGNGSVAGENGVVVGATDSTADSSKAAAAAATTTTPTTTRVNKAQQFLVNKVKDMNITKKLCKFTREQKAAKTLGIVMGVFIICWLPFFIYNVITGIFKAKLPQSHELIYAIFTWLGFFNSCCNPIIYAFSSRDFRRAFSKILCPTSFLKKSARQRNLELYNTTTLYTYGGGIYHGGTGGGGGSGLKPYYKHNGGGKYASYYYPSGAGVCMLCKAYEQHIVRAEAKTQHQNSLASITSSAAAAEAKAAARADKGGPEATPTSSRSEVKVTDPADALREALQSVADSQRHQAVSNEGGGKFRRLIEKVIKSKEPSPMPDACGEGSSPTTASPEPPPLQLPSSFHHYNHHRKWNSIAVAAMEAERKRRAKRMTVAVEVPIAYSSLSDSLGSLQSALYSTGATLSSASSGSSLAPPPSSRLVGEAGEIRLVLNTTNKRRCTKQPSPQQRGFYELVDSAAERQYIEIEQPAGQKFRLARNIQLRLVGMLKKYREGREPADDQPLPSGALSPSSSSALRGDELQVRDSRSPRGSVVIALREQQEASPAQPQPPPSAPQRPFTNMFQVVRTLRARANASKSLTVKAKSAGEQATAAPKRHSDVLAVAGGRAAEPALVLVNQRLAPTPAFEYDESVRSDQVKMPLIIAESGGDRGRICLLEDGPSSTTAATRSNGDAFLLTSSDGEEQHESDGINFILKTTFI